VSKYGFGMALAGLAGFPTTPVTRGSVEAAGLAAKRPKDMSLGTRRLAHALGHSAPNVVEGLRRFLTDRERGLSERSTLTLDSRAAVKD
jgi:dTDP-4-dehydrorhamnose reductase